MHVTRTHQTTIRTLGELRRATASLPDEMPIETLMSDSACVRLCPAEPAGFGFRAAPIRLEIIDPEDVVLPHPLDPDALTLDPPDFATAMETLTHD